MSSRASRNKSYHRYKYTPDWHPKLLARAKLHQALKYGRVKRHPCEVCSDPRSQAHHDDYSKPLKVRWLCALCHADEHVRARKSG